MKKIIITIILILSFISVYSQTDIYRSILPITDSLIYYINNIEKNNKEIVFTQTDIISKKCSKSIFRNFYKNWAYNILIFGDWRIKNISVEIFKITDDDTPNIYIKGCYNKCNFQIIQFTPDEDNTYMINIYVTKFTPDFESGHCGTIIYHD